MDVHRFDPISERVAAQLGDGDHRLDNAALREAYGLARITTSARTEIASSLWRAGVEVISDPRTAPLVVRKRAAQPARPDRHRPPGSTRPWFKRKRYWALAVVLVGLLSSLTAGDPADKQAAATTPTATTAEQTATPTATPVARVLAAARDEVDQKRYRSALAVVAKLGSRDRSRIRRAISRDLARRASHAVDTDRTEARRLLDQARRYPRVPATTKAAAALRAADRAAAERRRRRADARARRSAERAAARAQRAAAETAAAPDDTGDACDPNYSGQCLDPASSDYDCEGGSGDGPDYVGTVSVVGSDPFDLDRDGDGIACDD